MPDLPDGGIYLSASTKRDIESELSGSQRGEATDG